MTSARAGTTTPWLWLAAAVAFSPALVELARHAVAPPRSTTPWLAAILLLIAAWKDPSRTAPHLRAGFALLACATALEIVGILGGASTLARTSLPVAILGVAVLLGRPSTTTALLSLWLVAIPVSLLEPVRADFEYAVARFVAAAASLTGADASAVGPLVRVAGDSLEIEASDAGLHLAHLLALIGWFAAARRGAPPLAALRTAAIAALLAIPLQPIFLALTGFALVRFGPEIARGVLDPLLPALIVVTAIPWAGRPGPVATRSRS